MKKITPEVVKDKERFLKSSCYREEKLDRAIADALKKIDYMIETMDGKYPSHSSTNNVYRREENKEGGWNQGFYSGILWIAYELSGDEKYKNLALSQIDEYYDRMVNVFGKMGHDVGFLYSLSCVAAYKLTGHKKAREAAIMAADHLKLRFQEKGQFIKAWGTVNGPDNYRLIVDTLLNLPILFWAAEETGDESYRKIAHTHYRTTLKYAVRDNGSSFHTFYFAPETGVHLRGVTKQGRDDDSCWSRGHGWVVYGSMLVKKYVDDPDAEDVCRAAIKFYQNRLPSDFVPFWDLEFTEADGEEKDSSAAPIVLCGMLELLKKLPKGEEYDMIENTVCHSMDSLYENYSTKDDPTSNGLLLHAVYSKPNDVGIDECNIWGCYFYMECLIRMKKPDWKAYW
ncbi:MAG: glycoside hydrolase family 88 protein [Clostridia bacterium]|nr:glycoside hydrolase family 88 protein [Clostridia bacterium]